MRMRKPAPEATIERRRRNPVPPSNTLAPGAIQDRPGQFVHGAYAVRALLRRAGPRGRRAREQFDQQKFALALSRGFASWESVPVVTQDLVDIAIELRVFRRGLISGLWRGQIPPRRYEAIAELQRRVLVALSASHEALENEPSLDQIKARMQQRE